MGAKHTPGPWTSLSADMAGTEGIQIRDAKQYAVATLTGPWTLDQEKANARLIAVAPEMLDELQFLIDQCIEVEEREYSDGTTYEVEVMHVDSATVKRIRALVSKATGGVE